MNATTTHYISASDLKNNLSFDEVGRNILTNDMKSLIVEKALLGFLDTKAIIQVKPLEENERTNERTIKYILLKRNNDFDSLNSFFNNEFKLSNLTILKDLEGLSFNDDKFSGRNKNILFIKNYYTISVLDNPLVDLFKKINEQELDILDEQNYMINYLDQYTNDLEGL